MKTDRFRVLALTTIAVALVFGSQTMPAFGADATPTSQPSVTPPSANQTPGVAAPLPDPYARVERLVADNTINDSLEFTAITPCRVANTRAGTGVPLANNSEKNFYVFGPTPTLAGQGGNQCNVPAYVKAVHVNVTAISVTGGVSPGYLTVYPFGAPRPDASVMNFAAGQVVANAFTVATGGGNFDLSVFNAFGITHVLIDILGYYTSPFVVEVNADGSVARATNGGSTTAANFTGNYQVNFPRDVTDCASIVTLGHSTSGPAVGETYSENRISAAAAKFVKTTNSSGVNANLPFTIRLIC